MKKIVLMVVAAAFVLSGYAKAEEKKIAVFDMKKVFDEYEKTKIFTKELEDWGNTKKADVEKQKKDIEEKMKAYYAQQGLLSDDAKKVKQKEIQDMSEDYQKKSQEILGEFSKREKEKTDAIVVDISVAAEMVAKELKYDLLFDKKALVFGGDDITAQIIKKVNNKK